MDSLQNIANKGTLNKKKGAHPSQLTKIHGPNLLTILPTWSTPKAPFRAENGLRASGQVPVRWLEGNTDVDHAPLSAIHMTAIIKRLGGRGKGSKQTQFLAFSGWISSARHASQQQPCYHQKTHNPPPHHGGSCRPFAKAAETS